MDKKRQHEVGDEEPVKTHTRKVIQHGVSLYHNIPELSVELMGVSVGEEVEVESYTDRIVVKRKSD